MGKLAMIVLACLVVVFIYVILQLKDVNKGRLGFNALISILLGIGVMYLIKDGLVLGAVLSVSLFGLTLLGELTDKIGVGGSQNNKGYNKSKKIVEKDLKEEDIDSYAKTVVSDFSKNKLGSATVFLYDKDMEEEDRGLDIGSLKFDGKTVGALFQNGSQLNQGAVIVKKGKITHSNVSLPVIDDTTHKYSDYGRRNKGALGAVRKYNCVVVTTSSEDGKIRIFHRDTKGNLQINAYTSLDHSLNDSEGITPNDLSLTLLNALSISSSAELKNKANPKSKGKSKSKAKKVEKDKGTPKKKLTKEERLALKKEQKEKRDKERAERRANKGN